MRFFDLESVGSTNSYLLSNHELFADMSMVCAKEQTAGRGQRGNHWESETGKNLTFSIMLKPEGFAANRQFFISEAVALGIVGGLAAFGIEAKVKWPNDIYVGDKKICGILIEHSVMGMNILHSVAGAGINVNQRRFLSDAPNPVSMFNIRGCETDLEEVKVAVAACIEENLGRIMDDQGRRGMHDEFMRKLWRGDGKFYPFRDAASGEVFEARIAGVEDTGILVLEKKEGERVRYAFKEVQFLI